MRQKGFNATTVDDICAAAEVTKGAFFHYFKSKEDIARAAVERFGYGKGQDLHDAPFRNLADPLDRVYGRLDFIKESVGGDSRLTRGCLIGMLAQELSSTNAELRAVCHDLFVRMAEDFGQDLRQAKSIYAPDAGFDPGKLAVLFVSVFQGSSLLAKAADSNAVLIENIEQFRGYLQSLFGQRRVVRSPQGVEALDLSRD